MESKPRVVQWEKLSVYVTGLVLLVTLWTFINQIHQDIADLRERVAKLEVKVEKLEERK